MFVKFYFLGANTFLLAYNNSDFLGKLIFLSLIFTSIACWSVLIHKYWLTTQAQKNAVSFEKSFNKQKNHPLDLEFQQKSPNPFYELYLVLKKHTIDLLNKNRKFGDAAHLSFADIEFVEAHLLSAIANQVKKLDKNLFILATIVGLAPLLGLLGTVWGILMTFSELQTHTNQAMLAGLSLALTTTVLGLLTAIPALIAYNYLKNRIRNFETEMEGFSTLILSSVEMQYRKVDVK